MEGDVKNAIKSTYESLGSIFHAFVKAGTKDPDFFEGPCQRKLDDLLCFLEYLESDGDVGYETDIIMIYNASISSGVNNACERIVFLSVIGFFFSRSEKTHPSMNIAELLETYSVLIRHVLKSDTDLSSKLQNKILKFSAYCLNQLMHKDPSFIHGICRWVSTRDLLKECVIFQGYLRWPKTNIDPSDRMMIAEAIVSMPMRGEYQKDRIFKSVVFQTLRLYGVPEAELLPAMSKLDRTDFYQECTFLCFCSIIRSKVQCVFENIEKLFGLLSRKHAVDSVLSVILQAIVTSSDAGIEEMRDKIVAIMIPLMPAVMRITTFRESTRVILLDILERLYEIDNAEMVKSFTTYLECGRLSAEMTRIACEYSVKHQFCCVTRQNCASIAGRFSRFAFELIDDTESLLLSVQIIIDSIHMDLNVVNEPSMKALLFILQFHPLEAIRNAIKEFSSDLSPDDPDKLDKEMLTLVFDLAMNFGKKAQFLTDAIVSIASKTVLMNVGITERKLFDYVVDRGHCESFKNAAPELVPSFVSMLDPEGPTDNMIQAIEALTEVGKKQKISLTLLEIECDFLSQFIDTNQDKDNLLASLSRTFSNVALQSLLNPELEDIPEYVEFMYQMCISGINQENSVLQEAVLLLFLAVYSYDVNHLISVEDLIEVASYIDRDSWLLFLEKFELLFGDQFDALLKVIYKVVPGIVAEVLLDKGDLADPKFAVFCWLMADNQEMLLPKLNTFLETHFPSVLPITDVNHVIQEIFLAIPEIGPYIIESAINYDDPKLQKSGQQMKVIDTILTILQLVGNRFQISTSESCNSVDIEDEMYPEEEPTRTSCSAKMKTVGWQPMFSLPLEKETSEEGFNRHAVRPIESYSVMSFHDLPMLVGFALKVSRGEIGNEEQVTALWEKLMSNPCATLQVFDYLVLQNVDLMVLTQLFSLCQFKEELITKFEEVFATSVIQYLCEQKFHSALIYFSIISSRRLMNKITVFACCLLIQLREASLFCEAIRFLIEIGVFEHVPVRDIECLMTLCSYIDKEELDSFIDLILASIERCTVIPYFRVLCQMMFCAYCRFPSKSNLFGNSFFRLLVMCSGDNLTLFDSLVSSVYEVALNIEESRPLPSAIIGQLVDAGFLLADLGLEKFSYHFASLLELRKDHEIPKERIDSLLLKADSFLCLGNNEHHNWRIINGLEALKLEDLEQMKIAAVFGGKYLKRKMQTVIRLSQQIQGGSREVLEFVTFLSLSQEIDVVDRINILNTLSAKFGQLTLLDNVCIPRYKKGLQEILADLQ